MKAEKLIEIIGADFFSGVPDSLLRPFCDCVMNKYGTDATHHVIAANEGNAVAIGAGYYMATKKVPVVYLQNSGEGNVVNPLASLLHDKVYGMPEVFIIGWRGEPGVKDEPQHAFQGEITLSLLDLMEVPYMVIDKDTTVAMVDDKMSEFRKLLNDGKQVAFVLRKGALSYDKKIKYENEGKLTREQAVCTIAKYTGRDFIVSTTGKASRELFEFRERMGTTHDTDFLTVGSMGHASSIALGITLQNPKKRVWCIDGDGAVLMHMGAMALIGANKPDNMVHVVINNSAHESVGGLPTVAGQIDICSIATACGYQYTERVNDEEELEDALKKIVDREGLTLLEIVTTIGARDDLGRPSTSPKENLERFMENASIAVKHN